MLLFKQNKSSNLYYKYIDLATLQQVKLYAPTTVVCVSYYGFHHSERSEWYHRTNAWTEKILCLGFSQIIVGSFLHFVVDNNLSVVRVTAHIVKIFLKERATVFLYCLGMPMHTDLGNVLSATILYRQFPLF